MDHLGVSPVAEASHLLCTSIPALELPIQGGPPGSEAGQIFKGLKDGAFWVCSFVFVLFFTPTFFYYDTVHF